MHGRAGRRLGTAARVHPLIDVLGVVHDLGDRAVEAEEAIGQAEIFAGLGERAHAADEVGSAAADHDIERRRAMAARMLAQRVRHRAEGLVDVGVVGLAADDEQHVGLGEPVLEADRGDGLHLLIGRIAAEIRGDDRGLAKHLGDQRVGAAAEGWGQDRALRVDHVDIGLALMGAELIDLELEGRGVGREKIVRQVETLPARVVAIEAAFEVTGDRRQAAFARLGHADRVQLERGHAVMVEKFPQLRQVLNKRRDDLLRRADIGEGIGDDEGLEAGERLEGHVGEMLLVEFLDVDAAHMGKRHGRRAEQRGIGDREIDLMLRRNTGFEGDPVGLGGGLPCRCSAKNRRSFSASAVPGPTLCRSAPLCPSCRRRL